MGGFLFCFFLAKFLRLFPDLAGMVNSILSLFMWVFERVEELFAFHALILCRSPCRVVVQFKLHHYPLSFKVDLVAGRS
jgi:hypothetical protein